MSRHGYSEDLDNWDLIRWRGRVASAIRGQRGQKFLHDLVAALDSMPEKRLIREELELNGEVCALGSLGKIRGVNLSMLDPEDHEALGAAFNIASCLAQEVMYENDEFFGRVDKNEKDESERRWAYIRKWAESHLKGPSSSGPGSTLAKKGKNAL